MNIHNDEIMRQVYDDAEANEEINEFEDTEQNEEASTANSRSQG